MAGRRYKRGVMTKRSAVIKQHKTSVSLERPYWDLLIKEKDLRGVSIAKLLEEIEEEFNTVGSRLHGVANGLSAAIRLWCLFRYADKATGLLQHVPIDVEISPAL